LSVEPVTISGLYLLKSKSKIPSDYMFITDLLCELFKSKIANSPLT